MDSDFDKLVRGREGFSLLVVDDDPVIQEICKAVGEGMSLDVRVTGSAEDALPLIEQTGADVVLVDLRMPSMDGMTFLKKLKTDNPAIEVILMTGFGSVDTAVDAVKHGAFDYLAKPFQKGDLQAKLQNVVKQVALARENHLLREQVQGKPGFGKLIGTASNMAGVYRLIYKVSLSNCPVLVLGESGTGKELVARSIHFQSARKDKPFLPVDCAGLVPTLIESELFGHVRGAFTGATRTKPGLMALASGGTLFLDEIGELPLDMQAKLLRALQEREVRPVGGSVTSRVDVRIVAASNRNLEASVEEGRFRRDLYYRLNVVKIQLPPLRERKNDIPHLVHHFLSQWEAGSRRVRVVSEEAMAHLLRYDWPGNVRELENVVQRALALGSQPVLNVSDLPSNLQQPVSALSLSPQPSEGVVPLRELERRAILRAVQAVGGDKLLAARQLGIGKTTLYRKLKEYELDSLV